MSHEFDEYDFLAAKNLKQPSIWDRIWMGVVIGTLPAMCLWWIPKYYFKGHERKLVTYLGSQTGKFVMRSTNLEQLRLVVPPRPLRLELESRALKQIGTAYNNYNKYFPVKGASARWLVETPDRSPEDPVVLYLHGGAYFLTTMPKQVTWCLSLSKKIDRLSVLEVDYTVSPNAQYPTQLNEAVATYLELQKSCKRIIVLGDSAGGHLTICLQKYLHENSIPKPFGVVLVSPWTELWPRYDGSYKENTDRDYLEISEGPPLYFCTPEEIKSPYSNPMRGDAEFWRGVFDKNTLNVWGEHELLRDTCREFGEVANITDFYEQPRGVHDVLVVGTKNTTTDFIVQRVASWLGQTYKPANTSSL